VSVTLARQVLRNLHTGEPLPDVYPSLANAKIRLRRSNLHEVAGQPGSMKTMWVLDWVRRLKVPTLYFSNDSDESTIASRMLAASTGQTSERTEGYLRTASEWSSGKLEGFDHVRWSFDPSPSLDEIDLEMEAFNEIYGEYPHLVVVDILGNVSYYEDSDHGSDARILQYLHSSARSSGAAFLVVHHATEAVQGSPCPPRSAILNKQAKLPVLILTVAVQGESFYVAPVKNRHGYQDASGRNAIQMKVNPEVGTFSEW
jgi:hypothetical protein